VKRWKVVTTLIEPRAGAPASDIDLGLERWLNLLSARGWEIYSISLDFRDGVDYATIIAFGDEREIRNE